MKHSRRYSILFLPLWLMVLAVLCFRMFTHNPDLAWHLAFGNEWLRSPGWPVADAHTYTAFGRPYYNVHWLFEAGAALVHRWGGDMGLLIAKFCILAASWMLILVPSGFLRRGNSWGWLTMLALLLGMEPRFFARPEIVSYLGVAVFLSILWFVSPRRPRTLWLLIPVEVVWANCEGLFILGPLIAGTVLAGEIAEVAWRGIRPRSELHGREPEEAENERPEDREPSGKKPTDEAERPGTVRHRFRVWWKRRGARLVTVLVLILAAPLLNPYGLHVALFPFQLVSRVAGHSSVYRTTIGEFLPLFSSAGMNGWRLAIVLVALVLSAGTFAIRGSRRGQLTTTLLYLGFLFMAVSARRNFALFSLVAAAYTADNLRHPSLTRRKNTLPSPDPDRTTAPPHRAESVGATIFVVLCVALVWLVTTNRFYIAQSRDTRTGVGWNPLTYPGKGVLHDLESLPPDVRIFNGVDLGGFLISDPALKGRAFIDGRLEVMGEAPFREYMRIVQSPESFERGAARWGYGAALLYMRTPAEVGLASRLQEIPGWRIAGASLDTILLVRDNIAQKAGMGPFTRQDYMNRLQQEVGEFGTGGGLLAPVADPNVPNSAGMVAYCLGWNNVAETLFRRALRIDKSFAPARENLEGTLRSSQPVENPVAPGSGG